MYRKASPTSPVSQGSYERYGFPYGKSIEWKTPRLSSNNSNTRRGSDGLPHRNLMLEKSFSEPSSPQLHEKHGGQKVDQASSKSYSQQKAERKTRQHSKESSKAPHSIHDSMMLEKSTDSTDLAEMLAAQQELQLRNMNAAEPGIPMRKWSSYSGLSNDGPEGQKLDAKSIVHVLPNSYHGSMDNLDRVYEGQPSHNIYQFGSSSGTHINPIYDQGTSSSIAYVAPLRQELPTHPTHDAGYSTPKSSSRSRTPSSTNSTDDADKWDSLLKAKDDLISQKDQIIDRQKKTIAQLQHQHLSMDAKLQHALLLKSCDQDSIVTLKLQEYQFETAQLRAQLSQITTDKNTEMDRLQRKLGETEYLLEQMDACVKDTAATKDKDADTLHNKISTKDKIISDLEKKVDTARKEKLNAKQRIDGLERYLSEVPTTEEHQNTLKTLKDVREECSQLKDIITNKDRKLAQMNKAYSTKSEDAKKFHRDAKVLKEKVTTLQTNLDKYKKNGPVSEVEFEDLKMDNERLEAELNRLKKVLEAKHKKMKALHSQAQASQKGLEERLLQEEETVVALRGEISTKDSTIRQLKKSLKDLAAQNQDLMEQTLNLKTECEWYEKARSQESEKIQLSRKLWSEFSKCVSDLKAIVQLCMARKNGEDPNMSLLLGLRGPSLCGDDFADAHDDMSGLTIKLRKIQEIQKDIDALRTFVSDQYAEDVGNNCIAQ